jgi:nucleoside 2-deoxyribosyltransferase
MKVVYVAGPFRGKDHFEIHTNICNAEALALKVWRLGAVAICPHLNTAHFQNAAPDDVWLVGDLELLRRCDAVIMTADWQRSQGAVSEHEFAKHHGIPVFYTIYGLEDWLKHTAPVAAPEAVARA